jgi:hypothetical protein
MEDVFARSVREFNTESARQRLDRRHSALRHVNTQAFLSDRTKIVSDAACVVKCAAVVPGLSVGPNDQAPRLSQVAKIAFHANLGRHLIADRDIFPGKTYFFVVSCKEILAEMIKNLQKLSCKIKLFDIKNFY